MVYFDCGQSLKIYIERPTGELIDISGMVTEFTISGGTPEYGGMTVEMDLHMVSMEEPVVFSTSAAAKLVDTAHTSEEWKCDWCGQVNKRKDTCCQHCGGRRSFLYGEGV